MAYGEAEKILKDTFSVLANTALSSNSEQFLQRAEERLMAPLDKSLKSLDSKVADLESKRIEAYTEVKTQISELGRVNRELRNQTGSLVQALRSPNVRGDWGQMQLRRTVEMAGMLGHCDFFEQISEATESGRLTPDMIVKLPAIEGLSSTRRRRACTSKGSPTEPKRSDRNTCAITRRRSART